jgi:ubiquinone/menaquinone biosynthesis C-methylase UbiE
MTNTGYVYDQAWEQERERLAGIEALWDPGTKAILSRYVGAGSRVLEAGAGGGSVVSWLASEVGDSGHVLAIDLDTRFVEPLASDVVEVR